MAKTPAKGERTALTLLQKIEVIRRAESGKSSRQLAADFGVGRTQIQNIIKRKREHLEDFEDNAPTNKKRNIRNTGNEEINRLCWEFFRETTSRITACSGPMLQAAALRFAKDLGVTDFKASNGWLDSFKKRHSIAASTMVGESAGVNQTVVEDWTKKIPELCTGYAPRDIYNMDESGLFYRATSTKTLFVKGEQCSGGKQSKERLTIMLCANMVGDKEKPLIIGSSKKPRCFRNIKTAKLPVTYKNNRKAWMTSDVFLDWLSKLDKKMGQQGRKILLFADNAPSHPNVSLRNIELKFFPPNTTSRLQPMDQGIIQTVKLKYRKLQLNKILTVLQEDKEITGIDIAKKITVLDAILWVGSAWRETTPETIGRASGRRASPLPVLVIATQEEAEVEPESTDIEALAQDLFGCGVAELAAIDNDLATCDTIGIDWSQPASAILQQLDENNAEEEEDDDDDVEEDNEADAVKNFSMFMECLDKMKRFCLKEGFGEGLDILHHLDNASCEALIKKRAQSRQTTMDAYFKKV
ncbi:TIGD4 [Branchiostoma lanceolatum]|uniref:TIGD4 protein n=1 Tax=Branchiostoma lanceolatum TaxID=7740 RepID=A0A8J9YTN2_BRALA|nr:TIGD4 [Branchiostoma lanceolatum]